MPQDQTKNPTLIRLENIETRLDMAVRRIEVLDTELDGITRKLIAESPAVTDEMVSAFWEKVRIWPPSRESVRVGLEAALKAGGAK